MGTRCSAPEPPSVGEQVCAKAYDLAAGCCQHRCHEGAQVALVPGEQYPHDGYALPAVGAFGRSTNLGTWNASAYREWHCTPRIRARLTKVSESNHGRWRCEL